MSNLTTLENVLLPLELQRKHDIDSEARNALSLCWPFASAIPPPPNSQVENVNVALARALVTRPSLILADEPSGNLDGKTGKEVMNLLFKLCRERNKP